MTTVDADGKCLKCGRRPATKWSNGVQLIRDPVCTCDWQREQQVKRQVGIWADQLSMAAALDVGLPAPTLEAIAAYLLNGEISDEILNG